MPGICWLASYPKSGNTWARIIIANLFANPAEPFDINSLVRFANSDARGDNYESIAGRTVEEMTDEEIHELRPRVHQLIARLSPDTIFVKTHNAICVLAEVPTITPEVTEGGIYVVRNPVDVASSYAHHFGVSVGDAVDALCAHDNIIVSTPKMAFQYLGSWSDHVTSWTTAPGLSIHVMRYEDMTRKPVETFARMAKFLGLPKNPTRLKKAIRFSAFDVVSAQENNAGFKERSKNTERFFRKGRVGDGRAALTRAHIGKLIEHHGDVMREFGYVSKNGELRT